jgi:ABC-2 type transport system ATP-binding protein
LTEAADRRAITYSGGMKRRLNLGAALIHQPRILLLDEPTTGVDPQSRNRIFEEIRRRNAAGMTIVYTSHYMEEVQALCTRIGIIDHGRLIACDTLPGLLQQMSGGIRFRVPEVTPQLRERVKQIPGVRLSELDGRTVELECGDVKTVLLRLVATLNELQIELTGLETEEPNLERVFLHLTGRALRD